MAEDQKSPRSPPIHQTPLYRAKAAYSNMQRRCKGGVAVLPAYAETEVRMSREEWLAWAVPQYVKFLTENPGAKPSVSRKGDEGHYEIGNVTIVKFQDNLKDQFHPEPVWRNLICPVCRTPFKRRANRVDFKMQNGGQPCCSRACGATFGSSKSK